MGTLELRNPDEAKRHKEAERPVVFITDTEKWIRDAVFRNVPSVDRTRYMANLTGALARGKPDLLYEGVTDGIVRTKLGILFNTLAESRTPGIYEITPPQRHKFWDMVSGYEKTNVGRAAPMLTPKTEDWLKTHVFWDRKKEDTALFMRNLDNALRDRNPRLLYAGISPDDVLTKTTLGRLYNVLAGARAGKGPYSITDEKKDEFFAMQEDFRKSMEARARPEPERAVAKREERKPPTVEEKAIVTKSEAKPVLVAARVPFVDEEGVKDASKSIFRIETKAGEPPTTFYIEATRLSEQEIKRFRAMFNANHADALAFLAKMPDVKLYVAHGEEWSELERNEMLAMLRQESERLKRVTHIAGESAVGSA
jgi:hypothetical protein